MQQMQLLNMALLLALLASSGAGEQLLEHVVTSDQAAEAARNIGEVSTEGCGPCGAVDRRYCLSATLLDDHCCCDNRLRGDMELSSQVAAAVPRSRVSCCASPRPALPAQCCQLRGVRAHHGLLLQEYARSKVATDAGVWLAANRPPLVLRSVVIAHSYTLYMTAYEVDNT